MSILEHKNNITSQNGEDGIIEYIFNKINIIEKGNFIEFGAWDGKKFSNTFNLLKNHNWSGIYIEIDSEKYIDLYNNMKEYNQITCINTAVGFSENDKLDAIIESSKHENKVFDFISIDIDGLDYWVFQKMEKYLPKVICIEVNAGHDPNFDTEVPMEIAKHNIGQSINIITQEAKKKGYFPLCYTGNLFLIQNQYHHIFKPQTKSLKDIYIDYQNEYNDDIDKATYTDIIHQFNIMMLFEFVIS